MGNQTVLVIGGSGMLLPATNSLLEAGNTVYLVARRPQVAGQHPNLHGISANWNDPGDLKEKIQSALATTQPSLAVLWIHNQYHRAVQSAIADLLAPNATVVDVRGGASGDAPGSTSIETPFGSERDYRQVVLGFVGPPGGPTRWLTDQEISDGALHACRNDIKWSVVGRIEPWTERP